MPLATRPRWIHRIQASERQRHPGADLEQVLGIRSDVRNEVEQRTSRPDDHEDAGRQRGNEHSQREQPDEQHAALSDREHQGGRDRGRVQPVDEGDSEHEQDERLHSSGPCLRARRGHSSGLGELGGCAGG